jgi:hypothetical protein
MRGAGAQKWRCAVALSDLMPLYLNSVTALLAVVAALAAAPLLLRWAVKLLRVLGVLGGLGVVTLAVAAAVLLFERH